MLPKPSFVQSLDRQDDSPSMIKTSFASLELRDSFNFFNDNPFSTPNQNTIILPNDPTYPLSRQGVTTTQVR